MKYFTLFGFLTAAAAISAGVDYEAQARKAGVPLDAYTPMVYAQSVAERLKLDLQSRAPAHASQSHSENIQLAQETQAAGVRLLSLTGQTSSGLSHAREAAGTIVPGARVLSLAMRGLRASTKSMFAETEGYYGRLRPGTESGFSVSADQPRNSLSLGQAAGLIVEGTGDSAHFKAARTDRSEAETKSLLPCVRRAGVLYCH